MVKSFPDLCKGCRVVQLSNDPSTSTCVPPCPPAAGRTQSVARPECRHAHVLPACVIGA